MNSYAFTLKCLLYSVLTHVHVHAGLPAGALNVVTGLGKDAGAPLSQHMDIDKISFTGESFDVFICACVCALYLTLSPSLSFSLCVCVCLCVRALSFFLYLSIYLSIYLYILIIFLFHNLLLFLFLFFSFDLSLILFIYFLNLLLIDFFSSISNSSGQFRSFLFPSAFFCTFPIILIFFLLFVIRVVTYGTYYHDLCRYWSKVFISLTR